MSFGIMALLLLALFFASLNIGSLKVSLSEMLRGMLGEVSENAATVFDLRFPRIFISMLAGAAIAVSGVLFPGGAEKSPGGSGGSSAFPAGQALRRW